MVQDFEYLDLLQNIESAVVSVYREQPDLTDFDVDKVYSTLIKQYRAEPLHKEAAKPAVGDSSKLVYERVAVICDWWLGRRSLNDQRGRPVPHPEAVGPETIIAGLKRLRKSLEMWNKQGGRQGYLEYISQFL